MQRCMLVCAMMAIVTMQRVCACVSVCVCIAACIVCDDGNRDNAPCMRVGPRRAAHDRARKQFAMETVCSSSCRERFG